MWDITKIMANIATLTICVSFAVYLITKVFSWIHSNYCDWKIRRAMTKIALVKTDKQIRSLEEVE